MDGKLEIIGGACPLVRVEGDNVPSDLFRIPALRAVVPLGWALPPHAYAGEVNNRAERLLSVYYHDADPDEYWTRGGSVARIYRQGNQSWLVVVPEPNSGDPVLEASAMHLAYLGEWEDRSDTLAKSLLTLGLSSSPYLATDEALTWRHSQPEAGKLEVDTGIWSVGLARQMEDPVWCVTLYTDCFRLMRGDPMAAGSDVASAALAELKRVVDVVSVLGGGGHAGFRVTAENARRPIVDLEATPGGLLDCSSSLLTPEEALCQVASRFPGSELAHWASVRAPTMMEHVVESSSVSLRLRQLLFLNGGSRSTVEVVKDLFSAVKSARLSSYTAEVIVGDDGDRFLRLERKQGEDESASLAEALLELASDDCRECVDWREERGMPPLSSGSWSGTLCLDEGRWRLVLRTDRRAMLDTGLSPRYITRELDAAGALVESLYGGSSMLVDRPGNRVTIRPADSPDTTDISTAAAWTVVDWLSSSEPGSSDELLTYLSWREREIRNHTETSGGSDKEA